MNPQPAISRVPSFARCNIRPKKSMLTMADFLMNNLAFVSPVLDAFFVWCIRGDSSLHEAKLLIVENVLLLLDEPFIRSVKRVEEEILKNPNSSIAIAGTLLSLIRSKSCVL